MLAAVMIFLLVALVIVIGFSFITLPEAQIVKTTFLSKQSYFLAEGAIEDAIYRLKNGMRISSLETLTLQGNTATTNITDNGSQKNIVSSASASNAVRKVQATLEQISGTSFNYGVQVGEGGLILGENSSIVGNVASNGNITGSGASKSSITGTALIAGAGVAKDIAVGQDAYAGSFEDCTVGNTLYYVTSFSSCPAGTTQQLGQPLEAQDFPISQEQIDEWKADAQAGGTQGALVLGDNATISLGPTKIDGDLIAGNNADITITGTVWVTGNITFGNTPTVRLDSSYGTKSGVLMADGAIDTGNTATLVGSGQEESYLLVLSLFGGGDAITLGNSATGAIFYAPNGFINIGNGLDLKEATGYGLNVGNNSTITYETGLANADFSTGPGGAFGIVTWKEIP